MAIITTTDYASYTNTTLTPAQTAYINALIPVVQDQIEQYLDRKLDETTYLEWYKYSRYIVLRQYPVTAIKYLGELDEVAKFSNLDDYTYEITQTALKVTDNALTTTTVTFGGAILTLADIKTAIEAALPPLTLTISTGYNNLSYKLLRVGTGAEVMGARRNDCQTKMIEDENRTLEILMDSAFQFWIQTDYTCDTNVFVAYTAGYLTADMPKALKMVAVNVIKDILDIQGLGNSNGVSSVYKSQTITNYSYTLADGMTGFTTANIASVVAKYYGDLEVFVKKSV